MGVGVRLDRVYGWAVDYVIAFLSYNWTFRDHLPNSCSAETYYYVSVEIATITEQYLKVSLSSFPVYHQFSFCVYVAGRL
jgi:hypothetical protein